METAKYNIYFSGAAILLLVTLSILYNMQLRLKIKQVFYYKFLMYSLLAVNILDLTSASISNTGLGRNSYGVVNAISQLVSCCFFLGVVVVIAEFYHYLLALIHRSVEPGTLKDNLLRIPLYIYCLCIISNPFTKIIFYVDGGGSFRPGWGHVLSYVVPVAYILVDIIWLYRKKEILGRGQFYACLSFCIGFLGGISIQGLLFPRVLTAYAITALSLLAIYFYQQSPDFYLDKVGGVFSQEGFYEVITEKIAHKTEFAVIYLIIEELSLVYRNFGTGAQNKLIRGICEDLENICETDVFRQDNRFYMLFDSQEEAVLKGGFLMEMLRESRELMSVRIKLSSKILEFHYPAHIDSLEGVISVTDYFAAREIGMESGVLYIYDEELFEKQRRYEAVKNILKEAILNDGLEMYYQPILCTADCEFHTAEALVRLKDDTTLGYVSPEEFGFIAERENLIFDMEKIILHKIGRFLRENNLAQHGISYIEINLSGKQCMQSDLADQLEKILREYGISPSFINFEITETTNIEMTPSVRSNIDKVIASGASFSLDDYGSGFANLQYMTNIPFKIVKIDKEIVWAHFCTEDSKVKAILPSTVQMLKRMGVEIVAEGIETREQGDALTKMGIEYLQGYYYSRPICEGDFLKFLLKSNG